MSFWIDAQVILRRVPIWDTAAHSNASAHPSRFRRYVRSRWCLKISRQIVPPAPPPYGTRLKLQTGIVIVGDAQRALFLVFSVLALLAVCGCGAPSQVSSIQSSGPGGSGGSRGSAGHSFKPRPFPGDFFVRLSPQAGNGYAAAEASDPALKEVFVSDAITHAVEVYSTVDAHQMGASSVPGPAGLSFSPDFSNLVIGMITPYICTTDPVAPRLTGQIAIPASYLSVPLYVE